MAEAMAGSRPCRAAAGRPNWPRAAAATWLPPWRLHTSHESAAPAPTIAAALPPCSTATSNAATRRSAHLTSNACHGGCFIHGSDDGATAACTNRTSYGSICLHVSYVKRKTPWSRAVTGREQSFIFG